MADKKPPAKATRKTPAKRGPTKAAALKALGLTPDDLLAIKGLRAKTDVSEPEPHVVEGAATISATSDPQASSEEPVFYARNVRHIEVGFRLTRQQKQGEKRTQLKPRGSRGDMIRLEPGDLKDPELQTQVSYGLIEVIPEGEALGAINKQFINQQTQVPSHIAALRNELGKEYDFNKAGVMASDEEAYGIKVADLNPDLMQGKLSDKEIKRDGGLAQGPIMQPVQTPSPGTIISDGFMAAPQGDASQMGNNDQRSQDVDTLARSKQFEGPGAGLGEVTVKVEPVRRVQ